MPRALVRSTIRPNHVSDPLQNDASSQPPSADGGEGTEPTAAGSPGAAPAHENAAHAKPPASRTRIRWINALIVVTTLLALVGMIAVFANRLVFNPDNWESTSTQLLQNDDIRSATSNYLVDQLYANVNVAGLIKQGLPTQFDSLAGPAAGALRNVAVQGTDLALSRPRVQALWAKANRAADQTLVTIVNGGKGAVHVSGGVVSLDLATVLGDVATRFGLPASITDKLPPSVAHLTVFKAKQLRTIENVGNAVKSLALWLTILVPILYGVAILLARGHRRRTLMTVGFAFAIAGLIGVIGRRVLVTQLTDALTNDASLKPAISAAANIGTQLLEEIAVAFVLVGAVLIASAWFAGPAGLAVTGRRAIAPFIRERPGWTYGIVAAIMILIFIWQPIPATGTPVGIVVFSCLAALGTEVLRRQTAVEFPDARRGDAMTALRARIDAYRSHRAPQPSVAPDSAPIADQLERLAALRDQGSITPTEYDKAKSSVLHA